MNVFVVVIVDTFGVVVVVVGVDQEPTAMVLTMKPP